MAARASSSPLYEAVKLSKTNLMACRTAAGCNRRPCWKRRIQSSGTRRPNRKRRCCLVPCPQPGSTMHKPRPASKRNRPVGSFTWVLASVSRRTALLRTRSRKWLGSPPFGPSSACRSGRPAYGCSRTLLCPEEGSIFVLVEHPHPLGGVQRRTPPKAIIVSGLKLFIRATLFQPSSWMDRLRHRRRPGIGHRFPAAFNWSVTTSA